MSMQQNTSATAQPGSTVDAAEIAKFSKLSAEWWDPKGKMAPLHRINPLRLGYIRDAACRKFERNVRSLNCLGGLRVLDIGCGAGLLCEPLSRLGAQVIGVDPSQSNIAAAKLHADKSHLAIDYRCTTVEEIDPRERFDIVLAMEVVEHVVDVGVFLKRCAAMLKPNGLMVVSTLNRNWKSFALAIVGAEYVLRWLPRGTHEWNKFVTPDELTKYLLDNRLVITEQTGVVYSPFADKWTPLLRHGRELHGGGGRDGVRGCSWRPSCIHTHGVVPAKAGTHTPRRSCSAKLVTTNLRQTKSSGYGSRPSPGRHRRL
ncbi:2-polyprenyl-6-hydroxyphenyl methylase/3-demethylubiquinone-9 3-methyltransferase [Bradyrhizobium sp. USDA 3311]